MKDERKRKRQDRHTDFNTVLEEVTVEGADGEENISKHKYPKSHLKKEPNIHRCRRYSTFYTKHYNSSKFILSQLHKHMKATNDRYE
jgi:hypothetical protein